LLDVRSIAERYDDATGFLPVERLFYKGVRNNGFCRELAGKK